MQRESLSFQSLAERAGHGDAAAQSRLQRELEPHMVYIVRRALRSTAPRSDLTQQIQAAAGPTAEPNDHRTPAAPHHVRRLARQVCAEFVHQLGAGRGVGQPACDTVCG
jgi:hypothetical protein